MKKVFALSLICFMALGATAVMADTRTNSLGLSAGQQIDDLDSIWLFPQTAANYGNVVDYRLENLGSTFGNWFGVIHKDWDDLGYIGIYVRRPMNQFFSADFSPFIANNFGILNGGNNWASDLDPSNSAWNSNTLSGAFNHVTATYSNIGFNAFTIQQPQNKADLFWAKDFSDATIGVRLNYAEQDNSGNSTAADTITSGTPGNGTNLGQTGDGNTSVIGLDLGVSLKNLGALSGLDLALGYSLGSANYTGVNNRQEGGINEVKYNDKLSDDNISELRANAVAKAAINDNATMRIFAGARLDNLGFKQNFQADFNNNNNYTDAGETQNIKNSYSDTNFNVGLACTHKVADGKALVIVGISGIYDDRNWKQFGASNLAGSSTADQLFNDSSDTEQETWWEVPVNAAVEAPIFGWLKARVGANFDLMSQYTEKIVQPTNQTAAGTAFQDQTSVSATWNPYQSINFTMGASAEFQNFTLDLQMNPSAFETYLKAFQPGNGIFYGTAPNMFTSAELKYAF